MTTETAGGSPEDPSGPSSGRPTGRRFGRLIVASTVGTTIEFYDFFLYATAATLVFKDTFFPTGDPLTGILLALVTYAVGFAARPLGGLVFGHLGDTRGRKPALVLSLVVMGAATFAIGLLPTYDQVGVLAPILLTLMRLTQGFALGGEWGGAVLLVAEQTRHAGGRRGFWTAWPQTGGPLGNLLSTAVLAILGLFMSEPSFLAWGWRIPFLLSAILVLIGLWVRLRIEESPLFVAARHQAAGESGTAAPLADVVRHEKRNVTVAMLARIGENALFYIFATFLIVYVTEFLKNERSLALNAVTIASVFQVFAVLGAGALSDRIGRRPLAIAGALLASGWAFVFFGLVDLQTLPAVAFAVTVGLVFHGLIVGAEAAYFSELFGTRVRYSGASVGYQLGAVFGGALAPIIGVALLKWTHSPVPVAIYIAVMGALTVIGMLIGGETHRRDLAEMD